MLREGGMPPAELEGAQLGMLGVWYLACLEPSESVYARPRMPRGRPFAMSCVAHGRFSYLLTYCVCQSITNMR